MKVKMWVVYTFKLMPETRERFHSRCAFPIWSLIQEKLHKTRRALNHSRANLKIQSYKISTTKNKSGKHFNLLLSVVTSKTKMLNVIFLKLLKN